MHSSSSLQIDWQPPDIATERWEFIGHPAKQEYYRRHGVVWEGLVAAAAAGRLTPWPRGPELAGLPVRLAYSAYDDYLRYLAAAKRNYRLNYLRMERELQRQGRLLLPAPIVLAARDEGLLFSGWRRLCLAWNYGMVPWVWIIPLPSDAAD